MRALIYLCRHGETLYNRERRLQGRRDTPLTARGEAQAGAMAALLSGLLAGSGARPRLMCSPLARARETARIIGSALGLSAACDERLAEIAFGAWEGERLEDIFAARPQLRGDPFWIDHAPGGETSEAVARRVAEVIDEILLEPSKIVIIVSHGVTGRLLRGVYAGLDRAEALALEAPQDAIFVLSAGRIEKLPCRPVGPATDEGG